MLENYTAEEMAEFKRQAKEKLNLRIEKFLETAGVVARKMFKWVPSTYQKSWLDAQDGELSYKKAINLHCLECVGYSRNEVKNCPATCCVLYNLRPFQEKKK